MAKVFGIHTIELRPGVKEEDFERFMIDEIYPLTFEGCEIYLLKGDKGARVGKYALLFEIESVDARNRAFGAPGGPGVELSEEVKRVLSRRSTFSSTSSWTDYVTVGK